MAAIGRSIIAPDQRTIKVNARGATVDVDARCDLIVADPGRAQSAFPARNAIIVPDRGSSSNVTD